MNTNNHPETVEISLEELLMVISALKEENEILKAKIASLERENEKPYLQ